MARAGRLAATLLVLALLLGGCSGRLAAERAKPDLTDLKRFARDQLAAHLQQVSSQHEILGVSWISHSDPSARFAACFDVDITDASGHTRYESYGVVVGLDANGDLVVLEIGPQRESGSPLY